MTSTKSVSSPSTNSVFCGCSCPVSHSHLLCLSCTGQGFITHCPCYPTLRQCLLCLWLLLFWLLLAARIRLGLPVHHIHPGMSTPCLRLKPPSPSLHLSPLTSQIWDNGTLIPCTLGSTWDCYPYSSTELPCPSSSILGQLLL